MRTTSARPFTALVLALTLLVSAKAGPPPRKSPIQLSLPSQWQSKLDSINPFSATNNGPPPSLTSSLLSAWNQHSSAAQARRQAYASQSAEQALLNILSQPSRTAMLLALAWLLSELSSTPAVEQSLQQFQKDAQTWWTKARTSPGGCLSPPVLRSPKRFAQAFQKQVPTKYQWMLGTAVGMILAPLVWSVGKVTAQCIGVLYVFSEGWHWLREYCVENDYPLGWTYLLQRPYPKKQLTPYEEFLEGVYATFDTVRQTIRTTPAVLLSELPERAVLLRGLVAGVALGCALGA